MARDPRGETGLLDARPPAAPAYLEVAVELPVRGTYHYRAPEVAPTQWTGTRVLVPFGSRGVTGVVVSASDAAPAGVERVKPIEAILDPEPQVTGELLRLCLWIADYYEAPPGEVLRAALPAGTRVTATSQIELTGDGRRAAAGEGGALPRGARAILASLDRAGGAARRRDLLKGGGRAADLTLVIERGLAAFVRDVKRARVRERTETVAVLARTPTDEERAGLERAPARRAVLDALVAAGGEAAIAALRDANPRARAHARALAEAGLVQLEQRTVRGDPWEVAGELGGARAGQGPPALTEPQARALAAIRDGLERRAFAAYLLHGITGSGKTEVYLRAIAEALEAGMSAVVLVPEISLTPQLAARFRDRFGDLVAVLHSGLSDRQRFDEWQRLRRREARIALGARSAIFAPVADLGVVVVDEEHDSSFKQEEGVRYNARDVALVRAQRSGAVCVLGSATPSLETSHAAAQGRYHKLELPGRATGSDLPSVEIVDLRTYRPEADSMLTAPLADAVSEAIGRGEQAILFLNRRGFATFVVCVRCGHAFRCEHCSVSLTYHRARDLLMCHYCGHAERVPETCPECLAEGGILRRGLGTEKVTDAVAAAFPGARVARLDRDVAAGSKIEDILGRVARREVDILVGTQMVTKGHDFPGVTVVGVLCADTGLSLPDFRAAERTFQLLIQVSGRAGRADRPGRVLIQSYRSEVTAVDAAREHDYTRFFAEEIEVRRELGYPPFGHLVAVRIDGEDPAAVQSSARALARAARGLLGDRGARAGDVEVLGPTEAPLARLKGRTRWHLWLRAPERRPLRALVRGLLRAADPPSGVRVSVDVDPVSTL